MKYYFDGKIERGNLVIWDKEGYERQKQVLEGCAIRLSLEKGNKRTNAQNAYWHGVVVETFMEAMAYEKMAHNHEIVHGILKMELNSETIEFVNPKTGEIELRRIPMPTATMATVEFNELIERAQIFGVEFYNIQIPDPNPEYRKKKQLAELRYLDERAVKDRQPVQSPIERDYDAAEEHEA